MLDLVGYQPEFEFQKIRRHILQDGLPNGLRYPRWGGRRDAVRLEKC